MILFINTVDKVTKISVFNSNAELIAEREWEAQFSQSETLLLEIDKILNLLGLHKNDLRKVIVNIGPGSYTGIRVGVTTANFLAMGLNIPVVGIENSDFDNIETIIQSNGGEIFTNPVFPVYAKEPFITKPKPRL